MNALPALRYTVRKLLHAPLFTIACILTLAIGIGATTAIFTVINGVLLKPLPYKDSGDLLSIRHTAPGLNMVDVPQAPALYLTYREQGQRVFDELAMWQEDRIAVTGMGQPEQVDGLDMTDGTLPMLGVRPMLGRNFTKEEDTAQGARVVLLSYGYWQRKFGGDPSAVGKILRLDGDSHEIIGVMPKDFHSIEGDPELYLPMRLDRAKIFMGNFSYGGAARLKKGATLEQVRSEMSRLIVVATESFPSPGAITLDMLREAHFAPNVKPLKEFVVGDIGKILWVLLGTVGIVLLIACANVANLYLVRAEGRQREIAIRTALGASAGRIRREFLAESVVLGLMGGVVGTVLAYAGVRLLVALGPTSLPRLKEISIDPAVLLFALVVSVIAGILFGLVPSFKYGNPELVPMLKEGRGQSAGRERHHARNTLVISQIALALVLLVASGLMIRSFQQVRKIDPGFRDPKNVLTLRIAIPKAEVPDDEAAVRMHELIAAKIGAIPGIRAVGLSSSIPLDNNTSHDPIYVEDKPGREGVIPPVRDFRWVGGGHFEALGWPVLAGRTITWADVHTHAPVAMVTEDFARAFFKTLGAAIGKRIRQDPGSAWREIIGVVGSVHDDGLDKPATPAIYWPMIQDHWWRNETNVQRTMTYAIRTSNIGTSSLENQVRQAVWSINPNLPLANVRTLDTILQRSMARTSFAMIMLGIAAGVALLLGAIGIYGVISYIVSQRTREIGVRMALGARRVDVTNMVLRHGMSLAAAGLVVGLVAAVLLSRLMTALLFGVSAFDPLTYGAVALAVGSIALVASWIPAFRAAGVQPVEALRRD